jgi:S1-C subfamily serine protease
LTGSGFVYDKDGDILTNSHVVGTAPSVIITFIDGNQSSATVVGRDPVNDIAVVKILGNLILILGLVYLVEAWILS